MDTASIPNVSSCLDQNGATLLIVHLSTSSGQHLEGSPENLCDLIVFENPEQYAETVAS